MELVANYEVQDFIAVFDASSNQSYAYATTAGYPFAVNEMGGLSAASESVTVSEDMITGIKDIDGLRIDNLQFDAVYDLQGRKIENRKLVNGQLSNGQLSNSKLKRGLYIIDGHKVMVK
jgi:hypothetical protein